MRLRRASLAFALVFLVACGGTANPEAPNPSSRGAANDASGDPRDPAESVLTSDDRLVRLGERFPGFAGFEIDEAEGTLIIYTSRKQPDVDGLQEAIARAFRDDLGDLEPKVVISRYSFRQLKRWYEEFASQAFSFDGVTMTDINEATNTIDIGVTDVERDGPQIYEAARRSGIPTGVVRVVHMEAVEQD